MTQTSNRRLGLRFFPAAIPLNGKSASPAATRPRGRSVEAGYHCERFDPAAIDLSVINWATFDACFVALHGGAGEDGRVQAQLECFQVPYTGSGPEASALAMNKSLAKSRLLHCGIPTLPFVSFNAPDKALGIDDHLVDRLKKLGFPLIIKPQSQGSSLGISCGEISRRDGKRHRSCRGV